MPDNSLCSSQEGAAGLFRDQPLWGAAAAQGPAGLAREFLQLPFPLPQRPIHCSLSNSTKA